MRHKVIALMVIVGALNLYSETYYYDKAGRLIQVAYDDGSGIAYSYDANGNVLESAAISLPSKPTGLVASVDSGPGIGLSWTASGGATEYQVYRRSGSSGLWEDLGTVPSDTVLFFDTSIIGDTEYYYRISAVGANGQSPYSDSTPPVVDPGAADYRFGRSGPGTGTLPYKIVFKAEPGKVYQLQSSQTLQDAVWTSHPYSLFPEGIESTGAIENASGARALYFSTNNQGTRVFFRIVQMES